MTAPEEARRTTVAEAIAAWEAKGPTSLTVALLADAIYGARDALARVEALLDSEPLIVYGIRRDMTRTPSGRGGELRSIPATPGYGMSGCPGDNLTAWIDDLRAALADES